MIEQEAKERVLVISDIQCPFHHEDTMAFLKAVKKQYKPTTVVNIGDLVDNYCLSAWTKDPDAISANDEITQMRAFIKEYNKVFPKGVMLESNHNLRLERAAVRAGIPRHFLKDEHAWSGLAKGWELTDEVVIDGVAYMHGDQQGAGGQNAALNRVKLRGRSVVAGHLHTQSCIVYHATKEALMFGMQVGCLIDHKALAFAYCKNALKKPILSVGIVDKGVPQIIPMLLDEEGRWTGRL
jgi:hypothetical protein